MKNNLQWPATANCLWVCLLFLLPLAASAQQKDSLKFNNRKYKYEVGIDMKHLFYQYISGTSLILKIRNDRSKFVPVSYSDNYRFYFNMGTRVASATNISDLDTIPESYLDLSRGNYVQFSVRAGKERVHFFNKFNLYYGVDAGLSYSLSKSDYAIAVDRAPDGTVYPSYAFNYGVVAKSQSIGAFLYPFFGVKYRFTDRFSASMESGLGLSISRAQELWLTNETNYLNYGYSSKVTYWEFFTNFNALSLLSFNYHFG